MGCERRARVECRFHSSQFLDFHSIAFTSKFGQAVAFGIEKTETEADFLPCRSGIL